VRGVLSTLAASARIIHDSPMNKLARKTVKYSLVFLALLVVVLLAAPFFIDANHYKGLIIEKAEQTIGRKVDMGGLHASFFPWVGVRLDNVRVANRKGFPNKDFLQVKSLDVRLALLPLLHKHIEIKRFVLDSPKLLLERDASGAGNWEGLFPTARKSGSVRAAGGAGTSGGAGTPGPSENNVFLAGLTAKSMRMLNGEVHYHDMRLGRDITLSQFGVDVDGFQLAQPVHVKVSGNLSGDAFSIKGNVGPVGDLSTFKVENLPLQADIQAKSITLEKLAAFIPALAKLGADTLALNARIEQRPNGLRVTAGTLALHGEHNADVAWKVEMSKPDRIKIDRVAVRMSGEKVAQITGFVHGIGRHLQYQVRVNTPALSREQLSAWIPDLQALYAAHPKPWEQIKVGLLAAGDTKHVEFRDIQLILNEELVQASGGIQFGPEPVVRLRIASRGLHIDPWLPQPEKSKAPQNQAPTGGNPNGRMTPDTQGGGTRIGQHDTGNGDSAGARVAQEPGNVAVNKGTANEPDLRFMDPWRVTVGLQIEHLFLHGLDLAHLHATISGRHGTFNLDPFRFELAGGQVSEKASLITSRYPAQWAESVKVRGVRVQPVLKALANTDMFAGVMQMDTQLNGVGLLPQAALAHLNGTGNILLRDGMIKGFDIAGTLRNITTLGQQSGPKQTDFSQLSGSFKVKNGVVSNNDLFMASPLFRLTGYGQVNLATKNIDYHVKPRLVGSLEGQGDTEAARKGLVIPLRIQGPLNAPKVKVEMDIKTLMGNVGNIEGILKGRKGGLKSILKGVLQGAPALGNSTPGAAPVPSPAPAQQIDRIRRKLKGFLPGF